MRVIIVAPVYPHPEAVSPSGDILPPSITLMTGRALKSCNQVTLLNAQPNDQEVMKSNQDQNAQMHYRRT